MKAGLLRERITLQAPAGDRDTYGAEELTYVDRLTVWAAIKPLRGKELVEQRAVREEITHKVEIRYVPEVNAKWRFTLGSRTFQIESVINVLERNFKLELLAYEVFP